MINNGGLVDAEKIRKSSWGSFAAYNAFVAGSKNHHSMFWKQGHSMDLTHAFQVTVVLMDCALFRIHYVVLED